MIVTPTSDQLEKQQNIIDSSMQYSHGILTGKSQKENPVHNYRKDIITYKVTSYQVADSIDIDGFRSAHPAGLIGTDPDELYYQMSKDQFITVYKYGVVCFVNYDPVKAYEFIRIISDFGKNLCGFLLEEEFIIEANALDIRFGFNKIEIAEPEIEIIRLVLLNTAQSVALGHYLSQTRQLLDKTTLFTARLGQKGNLGISVQELKKFIGVTLNLKNEILENLYIVDSPADAMGNEVLMKIDIGMKKTLRLEHKLNNVQEQLKIVTEHLELFSNMIHQSSSLKLEWVIIILVFIEVLNTLVTHIWPM